MREVMVSGLSSLIPEYSMGPFPFYIAPSLLLWCFFFLLPLCLLGQVLFLQPFFMRKVNKHDSNNSDDDDARVSWP